MRRDKAMSLAKVLVGYVCGVLLFSAIMGGIFAIVTSGPPTVVKFAGVMALILLVPTLVIAAVILSDQ